MDAEKKQELFDGIVKKAVMFLNQAVGEFEEKPTFAIISFHAALELFLKARIFHEHWTLIIAPNKAREMSLKKFLEGNFNSVNMDAAIQRLDEVCSTAINSQAVKSFNDIRIHRNRSMHFYIQAEHDPEGHASELQNLAKELIKSWGYLEGLLLNWSDIFVEHIGDIAQAGGAIRRLKRHLEILFEDGLNEAVSSMDDNEIMIVCDRCEFESSIHINSLYESYTCSCFVCGYNAMAMRVTCPSSDDVLVFTEDTNPHCPGCEEKHDKAWLINALKSDARFSAFQAGPHDMSTDGNCELCNSHQSIIRLSEERYICTSCFSEFDAHEIQQCQWCHEYSNFDNENSYLDGCGWCEGNYRLREG